DLLRGPFLHHLQLAALWRDRGFGQLTARLLGSDEECVDHLAAGFLTQSGHNWSASRAVPPPVRALVEHYRRLAEADPRELARRGSSALGRLPAAAVGPRRPPAPDNP